MSSESFKGQCSGGDAPVSSDSEGRRHECLRILLAVVNDAIAAVHAQESFFSTTESLPEDDTTSSRAITRPVPSTYNQMKTPTNTPSSAETKPEADQFEDATEQLEDSKSVEKTIQSLSYEYHRSISTHSNTNIGSVILDNDLILMNNDDLDSPVSSSLLYPLILTREVMGKQSSSELCAAGPAAADPAVTSASGHVMPLGAEETSASFEDLLALDCSAGNTFSHISFRRRLTAEEDKELRNAIIEAFTRNSIPISGFVRANPEFTRLGLNKCSQPDDGLPPPLPNPTLSKPTIQVPESFVTTSPTTVTISSKHQDEASESLESSGAGTSHDAGDELEGASGGRR